MIDRGWYDALTGGPAPDGRLEAPDPRFFGAWTDERFQREIQGALQVRHQVELFSGQRKRCRPVPPEEAEAELYILPHHDLGIFLLIGHENGKRQVLNFGAAAGAGSQHRLRIERAHLWPDRVQAALECTLLAKGPAGHVEEIPITFHDWQFAVNRGFYEVGKVNDFILTGFAMDVRPSPVRTFEIDRPVWADKMGVDPSLKRMTFDVSELATMLAHPALGVAGYEFRGKIMSVKPMLGETDFALPGSPRRDDVLGTRVRRVRTRIIREPDVELDIMVSEANTPDLSFLVEGAWVEGSLMLSGYCWF